MKPPTLGRTLAAALVLFTLLPAARGLGREEELDLAVPSVSCTLLTDKPITVGDPIDVGLIVFHKRGEEVAYPKDPESFLPFTLRETVVKQKKLKRGVYRTLIVYTITIFRTGSHRVGPFEVKAGGTSMHTEPLDIRVLSVLPQDEPNPPLKDIVHPYKARTRPFTIAVVAAALAAAAALAHFTVRILRRKRTRLEGLALEESEEDPYDYSIGELQKLRRDYAERRADPKESYSKISLVLRFFIGKVCAVGALRMTTREIGRSMKKSPLPLPHHRILTLLKRSDMVKFAKEIPPAENLRADIDEAARIVEEVNEARRASLPVEPSEPVSAAGTAGLSRDTPAGSADGI